MQLTITNVLGNHDRNYPAVISSQPPEPAPSNAPHIDTSQSVQWVNAHEKENQRPLRLLLPHIERISFKTFKSTLSKSIGDIRRRLLENFSLENKSDLSDRLVVLVEAHKSNQWVAELACKHFQFTCHAFYRLGDKDARSFLDHLEFHASQEEKKSLKGKVLVLFDDASYSGNQLNDHLTPLLKLVKTIDIAAVAVVVPYMTETAEKLINENVTHMSMKNYCFLSTHEMIPTVSSAMKENQEPLQRINELWWSGEKENEKGTIRGTVWFDHKVPNGMSLPEPIKFGTVRSQNVVRQKFQVIPTIKEPYKNQ
jgi:hypothetical protein